MFQIKSSRHPADDKQIRVLIIGPPGSGKSFASLTFPNPVVNNTDRGLLGHRNRTDIQELPFYDKAWMKTNYPNLSVHISILQFIKTTGKLLEQDQTLINDSLTTMQDYFHSEKEPLTPTSKSGSLDKYWIWQEKLKYLRDIHLALGELRCHVVSIVHEVPERDEQGNIVGYRNALTGAFGDILGKNYTDIFRQVVEETKTTKDGKLIINQEYKFQIKPEEKYKLIKTRQQTDRKFIPASFEAIKELYKL